MAQDYNEYLAANVLNEQQIVSYRSLSRALKVHSNLAKQMLFEFHRKQNAKKPGTVHATYLVAGIRKIEDSPHTNSAHSQDSEDTLMRSSPPLPSSSAPQADETMEERISFRSIMLVKEEHLDEAKQLFKTISSIHIYSLEANGLSDVQALTECNRKITASYASEDPLQDWKQYGTIWNPNAKRRARRTAPPPPAPVEKNAEAKTKPFATTAKAKEAEMKAEAKPSSNKSTPEPEKKAAPKPAQTKRQNSDIFKSFAKGQTKAKEESQSSVEASPAPPEPEDEFMGGFPDDDDMAVDALEEQQPEVPAQTGKSKKEREAELQAMMDAEDEDEPMQDANTPVEQADQPAADAGKAVSPTEEQKESVTVENGRRRGKRRIMKKKTVKDEDGYLVTREEPAWESFSEEEPAPKKIKGPLAASASNGSKPVTKKGAKPGQGNIMSFFGKR